MNEFYFARTIFVCPFLLPPKCPGTTKYTEQDYQTILAHAQLLHETASHQSHYYAQDSRRQWLAEPEGPLLVTQGERFTRIVVDGRVDDATDVMFLGTGMILVR